MLCSKCCVGSGLCKLLCALSCLVYAQVMMKLKNARNLDARQSMLVDSAYYQCNPPQHSALKRKRRPVVQDWMRYLVFVQLGKDDVRKVRTQQATISGNKCFHLSQLQLAASQGHSAHKCMPCANAAWNTVNQRPLMAMAGCTPQLAAFPAGAEKATQAGLG